MEILNYGIHKGVLTSALLQYSWLITPVNPCKFSSTVCVVGIRVRELQQNKSRTFECKSLVKSP